MLEKPSRGVVYTRKLCKQSEQIVLHQARWCNWLTRRPLKAESTGSSPVRAIFILKDLPFLSFRQMNLGNALVTIAQKGRKDILQFGSGV